MSPPITDLASDRLVISLDFGTTFSGVAYAFNIPNKKADVIPIVDWPGLKGYKQPKVPTLILYDEKDPSKFKWGGQVNWRDPAVHGVKLLLDPNQKKPDYLPASTFDQDRKDLDKDPVDVAADFIGAIYSHALSVVESSSVRDYFHICQKEFVLSVPAVWSDKAKDLTLRAAKKAGIHPVTLVKEPEAAALYTLSSHDHAVKAGDSFVLCDAGGGTVDLITYAVKSIQPLQLAELVPGDGGMAGSLMLNKRFEEVVKEVVGENQFASLKGSVGWTKAINEFDKIIKPGYEGDVTDIHYISFPMARLKDNPAKGLFGNCWEMTGDVLQSIFDPVVEEILRLVDEQVQKARSKRAGRNLKGIFLVGGFGSSLYLKKRLQDVYDPQEIQVIQPPGSWGAIVNGSVLNRVSNQVTVVSTQAVRHYGVAALWDYNYLSDQGITRIWDPEDACYKVKKLTWYIYKGEDLQRDHAIKFPFFRSVREGYSPLDLLFTDSLHYSTATVAPTYPGSEVNVCCVLHSDLRGVGREHFEKETGADGKTYYHIHYELVVSTAAANLKFSLEVKGKEMGSVEATFT